MLSTRHPRVEAASLALVLALLLAVAGCRSEVVVSLTTRLFADGAVERSLHLTGRTAEGELPDDDDWLATTAGVALAEPGAWSRIVTTPGSLTAESAFLPGVELPPVLRFGSGARARPSRDRMSIEVARRGVLTRWSVRELHGDPLDPAEVDAALDALIELVAGVVGSELARWLGEDVEIGPGVDAVRRDGGDLARALVAAARSTDGGDARLAAMRHVAIERGVELTDPDRPLDGVTGWLRDRVADALGVAPDSLGFWPRGNDDQELFDALVARHWGDDERFFGEIEPLIDTLSGYFDGERVPHFRFELRVELPGRLLRTSGTPDGDAAIWLFRNSELQGERTVIVSAVSVEADREALVALGARRDLSINDLLRLEDLLWRREGSEDLGRLLDAAIADGSLRPLREPPVDDPPASTLRLAAELAELLDPAIERAGGG